MNFYAHTLPGQTDDESQWEPLFTPFGNGVDECQQQYCTKCAQLEPYHGHLNKVAWCAAEAAAAMFPPGPKRETGWTWGYLTGLWHDLGKFPVEWQRYLKRRASDAHTDEISGKVDHSTAGAQWSVEALPRPQGHVLAYVIASHHAGLLNGAASNVDSACLLNRLRKKEGTPELPAWRHHCPESILSPEEILSSSLTLPPDAPFAQSFFTRMLFSCLVDADFLMTERFMDRQTSEERPQWPKDVLQRMLVALSGHSPEPKKDESLEITNSRRAIRAACVAAADHPQGIFSLTVPTGGGKTLSSLAFALHHALRNGMSRVIYVAPFTTIIEQNADVFREVFADLEGQLGFPVVLEHHSNLEPRKETELTRLMAENWDAPLVVTTSVQFFESFYAHRTSRCRKLHRCARSVIVFDEAQAFPPHLLKPCLAVITELRDHFGASAVLCTATQPAYELRSQTFRIGFDPPPEEIIPKKLLADSFKLFATRIGRPQFMGQVPDAELVSLLTEHDQVLCVVNTKGHALKLYRDVTKQSQADGVFHLSTRMCPAHRSLLLGDPRSPAEGTIRHRLLNGLPCKVISTQLIEAGVDISFPAVFRSYAGLDSICQSFGRCNRHGGGTIGQTFVFESEHEKWNSWLADATSPAQIAVGAHQDDPIGLASLRRYFVERLQQQRSTDAEFDKPRVHRLFTHDDDDDELPLRFGFTTASKAFHMIEDQMAVFIPFGEEGKRLEGTIRQGGPWKRADWRSLQRHTVSLRPQEIESAGGAINAKNPRQIPWLISSTDYTAETGLQFDPHTFLCAGD